MTMNLFAFLKRSDNRTEAQRTGDWGERVASGMLKKKGYHIITHAFRMGRREEIDLVARDGETLVFVEVKTRANEDFGRPASSVNANKRRALSRAAVHYLKRLRQKPNYFRFDVVEVIGSRDTENPVIRHIENAFPLDKRYHLQW
jgi:putative endonuclease